MRCQGGLYTSFPAADESHRDARDRSCLCAHAEQMAAYLNHRPSIVISSTQRAAKLLSGLAYRDESDVCSAYMMSTLRVKRSARHPITAGRYLWFPFRFWSTNLSDNSTRKNQPGCISSSFGVWGNPELALDYVGTCLADSDPFQAELASTEHKTNTEPRASSQGSPLVAQAV